MKPFGNALMAYHKGDISASFRLERDDGFIQDVPASIFFATQGFPALETKAFDMCKGHILDIGAGAGRHSLALSKMGAPITALDILPSLKQVMLDRGVNDVIIADIFGYSGARFDTLLMLMNGIGMVANPSRLTEFLTMAHKITHENGQIICDSIDVSVTTDPTHMAYTKNNIRKGKPVGQQSFVISYGNEKASFEWLHIDFVSLQKYCDKTGWKANLVHQEPDGRYLCRLTKMTRQFAVKRKITRPKEV